MGLRDLLPGGVPSLAPEDALDAVQSRQRRLLDVREAHEFAGGHAPGARHAPLGGLDVSALSADQRYVLVCQSGARSAMATRRLRAAGLDALNLRGGMAAWTRAGLPVERSKDKRRAVNVQPPTHIVDLSREDFR